MSNEPDELPPMTAQELAEHVRELIGELQLRHRLPAFALVVCRETGEYSAGMNNILRQEDVQLMLRLAADFEAKRLREDLPKTLRAAQARAVLEERR
jgi:hypothetical protein